MKRKLVFICLMGILVTLTVNAQPKVVAHRDIGTSKARPRTPSVP